MADADLRRLLRGYTTAAFLRKYWHKEALVVPEAIPGFRSFITRDRIFALATRDDVESRLVRRTRGRHTLVDGPFRRAVLERLPARDWTLLVQGVNLHLRAADALLRRFAFVPYARLDDLMVSYAAPGGGVGPHFDSYDVFLLQASGRRQWRYGRQHDLRLRPDAPLRILSHFAPTHEITLAPGGMLYLPPDYAHDGIALDECVTCSIGFRAPMHQVLAEAFIDHLRDAVRVPGRYADPDLRPTRTPARIDSRMRRRMADAVSRIRPDAAGFGRFLGRYLTEPKPVVAFAAGPRCSRTAFRSRIERLGVRLDARTQLLYDDTRVYINGADIAPTRATRAALHRLANRRELSPGECAALPSEAIDILHHWHRHGFLDAAA